MSGPQALSRLAPRLALRAAEALRKAPARPRRGLRGGGLSETSTAACLDLDSSPGRLAPVAAASSLGPDLPDASPWGDSCPAYGPQAGTGCPAPRGFLLDRYVY